MSCQPVLELDQTQQAVFDDFIFQGRQIHALMLLRDATDCSLAAAINVLGARFDELKRTSPGAFEVDIEAYWVGSYP